MTAFSIDYSGAEWIGQRDRQEDAHLATPLEDGRAMLIVLADGMGGHAAGDIAAQTAVERFTTVFCRHPAASVAARLGAALQAAQESLAEAVQLVPQYADMGCTIVGAHIGAGEIHWISVGDSPLLLLREGTIAQLNEDHSMAPVLDARVASGDISRAEADGHSERQSLRSVLTGAEPPAMIDCPSRAVALRTGDAIILASDGLQILSNAAIARVLAGMDSAEHGVGGLLDAVGTQQVAGQDNVTVQVVRYVRAN